MGWPPLLICLKSKSHRLSVTCPCTEIIAYRQFPTFKGEDDTIKCEVPIPMVTLIAMAVSVLSFYILLGND